MRGSGGADGGLAARRLLAQLRKTWIASTAAPSTFLGFELFANGRRRLPDENVARFRSRLRGLRDRWRAGTIDEQAVRARVEAWIALARHADFWCLRKAMFSGGWFDPADTPSRRRQDSAT